MKEWWGSQIIFFFLQVHLFYSQINKKLSKDPCLLTKDPKAACFQRRQQDIVVMARQTIEHTKKKYSRNNTLPTFYVYKILAAVDMDRSY